MHFSAADEGNSLLNFLFPTNGPYDEHWRKAMARDGFWSGFGLGTLAGAAVGAGACAVVNIFGSNYDSRILRLERSIQIGRPVEEVFAAWSRFEELPERISILQRVETSGKHSNWTVDIDGKVFEFDGETEQVIPNESVGWKSITGPKHSGRVSFAQIGNDTLLHVTMNYAPPLGGLARLFAPVTDHLEGQIDVAFRDFKRSLEAGDGAQQGWRPGESASEAAVQRWSKRPPASAGWDEASNESHRATGTDGVRTLDAPGARVEDPERRDPELAVDYTRPPKERY
jgi:uncharacterized membrane protein